jgi:hypothetical protein
MRAQPIKKGFRLVAVLQAAAFALIALGILYTGGTHAHMEAFGYVMVGGLLYLGIIGLGWCVAAFARE